MLVTDVAVLPERVKRELIRGENARAEFAIRAQSALKEAMDQMGPLRHIDGLGRRVTTIHPELAARLRVKFGNGCLHDPDFLKSLMRDNPFLRVQCVPAKLTIRVDGLRNQESRKAGSPSRSSGRLEDPQGSQIGQGKREGKGAPREVVPVLARSTTDPGSLLAPGERDSTHETPSRSCLAQSANSAERGADESGKQENRKGNFGSFVPEEAACG